MIPLLANTPVPRDLPLPLPLPEGVLIALLVIFFLVHILFVNLMVGGSVLVTFFEWLGRKDARWDRLAAAIGRTITVNKSLAVVMGIGPLLCINLVYTMQWYSANSLTGHAWLMIVPLVIVAFLLTYLHKYKWESWSQGGWKSLHQLVGLGATLLLLGGAGVIGGLAEELAHGEVAAAEGGVVEGAEEVVHGHVAGAGGGAEEGAVVEHGGDGGRAGGGRIGWRRFGGPPRRARPTGRRSGSVGRPPDRSADRRRVVRAGVR